ncbi:MAG: WYL domain-containing protein [Propionibacterium sp.]|nr:WYL domain-containing protein [Propionibacterium sp.]
MSSLQQVPRLLALVPYLVRHPGARVADVAVDFGVSPEQVRRDLHVLWYCGVSGMPDDLIDINMDQVDQHGVIHLSNADFLSRPLVLSPTEALTLVVGLQALRQVAGPDAVGAIDQALAKVRAALGTRSELPDQVVVEVRSAADRVRATLDEAIARQRRIEMEYQPDHVLESQRRNVDPHSVAVRDGYAYLEAYDLDRQGWRSFRLDRIVDAVVTSIPAGQHGAAPSAPGRHWLSALDDADPVDLWLAADARWVAEKYPVEATRAATAEDAASAGVEPHPDDLVVTMLIAEPEWLTRLLLRLGQSARVLNADRWRAETTEAAERARRAIAMHQRVGEASGRVEA